MRRLQKWAALVLSAALVVTSIQTPVFGATEDVVTVTEVTEENVSAEDTADETEEVSAVTEEVSAVTEEASAAEGAVGSDTTVYVHSQSELVSALEGTINRTENDAKAMKQKDITISLEESYNLEDAYNNSSSAKAINDSIKLASGKNITLLLNNKNVTLSSNVVNSISTPNAYKYFVVDKDTSFTVDGSNYSMRNLPFGIDNAGTTRLKNVKIYSLCGYALKNSGTAIIESGAYLYAANRADRNINLPAVRNEKGASLTINSGTIAPNGGVECALIYNDNGKVVINGGWLSNTANSISANGIENMGAEAECVIRGGYIETRGGYGIVNKAGKIWMPSEGYGGATITGELAGIASVDGGQIVMENEGTTIQGGTYGIAATKNAVEKYIGAASDGAAVQMQMGYVSGERSGIAYSDILPVLVSGTVRDSKGIDSGADMTAAVQKFVSWNGIETDATKYAFQNKDGKTIAACDGTKPLHTIKNGGDAAVTAVLSGNTVSTNADFKAAAAAGGTILVKGNITLSENMVFAKDTKVNIGYATITMTGDAGFTINAGATVNVVGTSSSYSKLEYDSLSANKTGITNAGTFLVQTIEVVDNGTNKAGTLIENNGSMTLDEVHIREYRGGLSENALNVIYNKKELTTKNACSFKTVASSSASFTNICNNVGTANFNQTDIYIYSNDTKGILNTGNVIWKTNEEDNSTFYGGVVIWNSDISDSVCVYNKQGSFKMYNGSIANKSHNPSSFAVVYEGNALPHFFGGSVIGGNDYLSSSVSANNLVLGSAVVKMNGTTPEKGFFMNSEQTGAQPQDGMNAWRIDNGIARMDSTVYADRDYILLEKGEEILDAGALFSAYYEMDKLHDTVSSANTNVLTSTLSANQCFVVKAVGVGYTTLTFTNTDTGVRDYARVEVVEQGGRAKIIASSYTGSILDNVVNFNAYQKKTDVRIDWHLKSSDSILVGGDAELLGKTFEPSDIVIENKDFNRYFYVDGDIQQHDTDSKLYFFNIKAVKGTVYNKLAEDNVSELKDIEVKLKFKNNETGKTELFSIGTFSIKVDQKAPGSKKADPVTLNSFYSPDYEFSYTDIGGPNAKRITTNRKTYNVAAMKFLKKAENYQIVNEKISYTGSAKKTKTTLKASVRYEGYAGWFDLDIPVTVINQAPKMDVLQKKYSVTPKVADGARIPVCVKGKTAEDVATVKSVEVVDNSKFTAVNNGLDGENTYQNNAIGKYYYINPGFFLQQNADITKNEKVTLKVTYENGDKYINGKEYSSTIKLTIAPAKPKIKATAVSLRKNAYTDVDGTVRYDRKKAYVTMTPSNLKNGYLKVGDAEGKLKITDVSLHGFAVTATAATANMKSVKLPVELYTSGVTTPIAKTMVQVNLKEDSAISGSRKVVMDINKKFKTNMKTTIKQMDTKIPVKDAGNWEISDTSGRFEVVGWSSKAITIRPTQNALLTGMLVPGESYPLTLQYSDLDFNSSMKETRTEVVTVQIKDNKDKAAAVILGKAESKNNILTLYKNAPYMAATFDIDTLQPVYGMTVKSVAIAGNSSYEVKNLYDKGSWVPGYDSYDNYSVSYTSYQRAKNGIWALTFKDNKAPKNAKAGAVTLNVTYTDGSKATVKVNVGVK